ncbi:MAG: hypothetical protein IKO32_10580 [Lachnospiraceae bacterium]|nr:hypothetical protein [Lachnospiraceae bacterium]
MENNVYFHVTSPNHSSAVIVIGKEKHKVKANTDPLIVTMPVGRVNQVKIKAIKDFFNKVGTNKTYDKEIFIPNEDTIMDVFISIGKAVVTIDIKPRP